MYVIKKLKINKKVASCHKTYFHRIRTQIQIQVLDEKILIKKSVETKIQVISIKKCKIFFLGLYMKDFQLQKQPPTLHREHTALQNMK
jgi:hypothetical protein